MAWKHRSPLSSALVLLREIAARWRTFKFGSAVRMRACMQARIVRGVESPLSQVLLLLHKIPRMILRASCSAQSIAHCRKGASAKSPLSASERACSTSRFPIVASRCCLAAPMERWQGNTAV